MKHFRLRLRPRRVTAATGCRWPAISHVGRFRGLEGGIGDSEARLVAEHHRPERNLLGNPPAEARRQGAVMIAGDPHHFNRIPEPGDGRPVGIVEPVWTSPVVERVAERQQPLRAVARDRRHDCRKRRAGVVGRQVNAMARPARSLLEMQVGHQQRPVVRRVERAGEIGHEFETAHPDAGELRGAAWLRR